MVQGRGVHAANHQRVMKGCENHHSSNAPFFVAIVTTCKGLSLENCGARGSGGWVIAQHERPPAGGHRESVRERNCMGVISHVSLSHAKSKNQNLKTATCPQNSVSLIVGEIAKLYQGRFESVTLPVQTATLK